MITRKTSKQNAKMVSVINVNDKTKAREQNMNASAITIAGQKRKKLQAKWKSIAVDA